jgi:putative hemolysin
VLAGAEIAIVALRRSRLEQLVQAGGRRARAIKRLRDNPERFLATVQIGITVIGATAGAFGGATFARDLEPLLEKIPGLAPHADDIALALVIAMISFLSIVIGELVPKSLALRHAEGYALLVGRPFDWLAAMARPFVWLLTASSNVVLRLFGDRTTFTEARVSPEEIQEIVDEAALAGTVDKSAGEIASRAIDFAGLAAVDVMLPRTRVVAISRSATPEEVQRVVLEHGHTRMPVYEGAVDNVVGYITVKDVLALVWDQKLFVLEDIVRPAFYVVETMRAVDLLAELRRRRLQLAIVVDDRGAMSGIVTMEDLVEEIVGDIVGENEPPAPEPIRRVEDGTAIVQGDVPVREVSRQLDVDLPEGERWSTMAGLCLELAGRIPAVGDRFAVHGDIEIEVVDATPRHVRAVRLRLPEKPEEEGEEEAAKGGEPPRSGGAGE